MKREIIQLNLNDIKLNEKNPRTINKRQLDKLVKSIQEFPEMTELRPIVVDENNTILGGNMRYRAMQKLGMSTAEVVRVTGLTDEQKREFIIKDNVAFGDWDWDALANEWDMGQLDEWGLDIPESEVVDQEVTEVKEDETPEVKDGEPNAKRGDIYQLGRHRLMCGDSTKQEDVAKLMNGVKADMVFTDPPYGVDIKGKYTGTILNDNLKDEDLENFLKEVNNNIKNNCNGSYYICYEVLNSVENFNAFGKPDEIICFNKDSASFYSKNKYNRKYELIMYYQNGKKLYCNRETNVWDAPKSSSFNNRDENGLRFNEKGNYCVAHPTTKPLLVPSRAIKNSSKEDNIILDLFGGSGSTLIACEQLNRKCYMMELDPHYVDVIIERWENFTGQKAKLLKGV